MLLIGVPVLAVLCYLAWHQAHSPRAVTPRAAQTAPVVATTVRVKQQEVPIYVTGIGTVTARESVRVKARIDGQLDKINFEEGHDVKAGQLLAQLDPRTQQAQLAQAQAQKAKDQALLANAELDLQRYAKLIKLDATTRQILDAQRSTVAQLKASVQSDDAQISYAATQLSYTSIASPISGRAGARLVDAGNVVHAADTTGLVVINQIDPISVDFTVPDDSFQSINQALHAHDQPLSVIVYPRNSRQALGQGSLVLVNNQIDTSSGTIMLKGSFPNPQHKLWPGQYVDAKLILSEQSQALTVPAAVVQRGPDGTYAYTVGDDGTVQLQAIDVDRIQDGIAVIAKGLHAGQRVVIDGQYKLRAGVHITESQPAAAADKSATQGNVK
jgi:multidrug efflux system membrane fusion protein